MWLKANYPLEWWNSILQNSSHEDLKENAKHFKKVLKKPDINISDVDFYIIDDADKKIVYPLTMIKGIKSASGELVKKRPYTSLSDMLDRVEKRIVNKRIVTALIHSGSLDDLSEAGEGDIASKRNNLLRVYAKFRREMDPEPLSLTRVKVLESSSLSVGQPDFVSLLETKHRNLSSIDKALALQNGAKVVTAGIISSVRPIKDKRGNPMCFFEIENGEYILSVTCFSTAYEEYRNKIEEGKVCVVYGSVNVYNEKKSVVADKIKSYSLEEI